MSLSSEQSRNDYTGNGAADTYPYTFRILRQQDLRVIKRNLSGVEFVLSLGVDFTVTGVGSPSGGNVTLVAGVLPVDYHLTIRRVLPFTQETDIRNQGDFYAEVHEDQFDRSIMVVQQLADDVSRSMRNPETVPASVFSPVLPANIATANRALVTNATGDGWTLGPTSADADRIFKADTYANLKALAVADPTAQRWGWATDIKQLVFYTANLAVGDAGWVVVG